MFFKYFFILLLSQIFKERILKSLIIDKARKIQTTFINVIFAISYKLKFYYYLMFVVVFFSYKRYFQIVVKIMEKIYIYRNIAYNTYILEVALSINRYTGIQENDQNRGG